MSPHSGRKGCGQSRNQGTGISALRMTWITSGETDKVYKLPFLIPIQHLPLEESQRQVRDRSPWGYFFIYSILCMCLITHLCLTLCNLMDCSPPGSSVNGILQARILEGVAISNQGSNPRLLHLLHWQEDSLPLRHHWGLFYLSMIFITRKECCLFALSSPIMTITHN